MTAAPALIRAARWLFINRRTGRVTIAQKPNAPLLVFIGSLAVGALVGERGPAGQAIAVIRPASLAVWAIDEVARGVNPWRRILGGTILAVQIATAFRS